MKKIKTIYPVILLTLLLLVSCKSKKNMVATLPRPVLNSDSIYPDTANAIAGLFSPDHSQLKELNVSKNKKQNTKERLLPIHTNRRIWYCGEQKSLLPA